MFSICLRILTGSLLSFLLFSPSLSQPQTSGSDGEVLISTADQLTNDVALAPCEKEARLEAVKTLFEKLGAPAAELLVEKLDNVENLTVKLTGRSPEIIVIGAHYDKVKDGCGAIDNWSGIVTIAHLYRSVKNLKLNKTLIFAAFGREEEGLLGSKALVKRIDKAQVAQYCAMINIDSLGLGIPQVGTNMSSKKLMMETEALAKVMEMPFDKVTINGDSDSSSFRAKKIPAITISGLADGYEKVIHTDKDKAKMVNPQSLYLGYRLALALIYRLEAAACDANRD
jgi:Zn-dependent M28 family amino/carboxypeptidase